MTFLSKVPNGEILNLPNLRVFNPFFYQWYQGIIITDAFYKSSPFIWYVTCPYDGNNGFFAKHKSEIHKIALFSIALGIHLGFHGQQHILWQNMCLKWICHDWDSQNSFLEHSNYPKNKKFEKGLIYEWRPSWIAHFHLLHLVQDVCWIQIHCLRSQLQGKHN